VGAVATNFSRAHLQKADLTGASLMRTNFSGADLRKANLDKAKLEGTILTGARIAGIASKTAAIGAVTMDWVDVAADDDGHKRLQGEAAMAVLTGKEPEGGKKQSTTRYFGAGDVLRFAALEFDSGATVEIESRFEQCSITLGEGTELVVGSEGVLAGCNIKGGGNITIHGQFFEGESPGIAEPKRLVVTNGGVLVGSVMQAEVPTQFAFEPGSRLRMKITRKNGKNGRTQ